MNINMRIITDENVDQLLSMSYSTNIAKLLHESEERTPTNLDNIIKTYTKQITRLTQMKPINYNLSEQPQLPTPINIDEIQNVQSDEFISKSSDFLLPDASLSPTYDQGSPAYQPGSPAYQPGSPAYQPGSPAYDQGSPAYQPGSPAYDQGSPAYQPESPEQNQNQIIEKSPLTKVPNETKSSESNTISASSILEVPNQSNLISKTQTQSESGDEEKKVVEIPSESSSNVTTSSGIKKIII
jgi:hypothetical protein